MSSPSKPAADSRPDSSAQSVPTGSPKIWQVGTLSYTSGGIVILFLWLLFGDFSWSMRDRSVGPMAQWYLNSIGVPNLLFGILMTSFPSLVGLVICPIISVKSDRHRSRWGRRLPFLLITTPIAAFGMIGIAVTPLIANWLHTHHFSAHNEMVVSVACFGVFWAAFEFATMAGGAVFGGLINDVVPKPLLGRFYGLFRAISLIDGIIFNYWLMGKTPDYFTLMLTIIGIFYGVSFMWVCFKIKEGDYPPPPPKAKSSVDGVKSYFRDSYSKPYYVTIYLFLTISWMASAPINTFALPYANSLNVSMDTYGKCLALTYAISLSISYFIGWLVDIFHPLRVAMAATALYAFVMLGGHFFATTQTSFLVIWVMHGVLSGTFYTSVASLGQRLYPHEKFAQYASAGGLVNFPAMMALAPIVGLIIDRSGNIYRYTFTAGAILAVISLVVSWIVHRQFMRYGGPKNYQAPQ